MNRISWMQGKNTYVFCFIYATIVQSTSKITCLPSVGFAFSLFWRHVVGDDQFVSVQVCELWYDRTNGVRKIWWVHRQFSKKDAHTVRISDLPIVRITLDETAASAIDTTAEHRYSQKSQGSEAGVQSEEWSRSRKGIFVSTLSS